ncbi:agrin isoform X2 [Anabrus simplex]|uniref:agrin isoform X2 n=1 Tax=Anabrus simplex TaxID=316456 RepID=UPI0035A2B291
MGQHEAALFLTLHLTGGRPQFDGNILFPGETDSVPSSSGSPTPSNTGTTPVPAYSPPACNCQSTGEYNPVCGTNNVTYDNPGKLKCAAACGTRVELSFTGQCPQ